MQIRSALPRVALATFAALVVFALYWWGGRTEQPSQDDIVVVQATTSPAALPVNPRTPAGTDSAALALVEQQILEAVNEPGTSLSDLRIVDQERQIACGERTIRGSAAQRRFVWLSQVHQVVTDDGGQDFAILVHVCTPPVP
jgi:hypothetical protein